MLSDYDEFVGLLKHHGDIASGIALVEPSSASSLVGSSSVRSVFATAIVVTQREALQLCGGIAPTSSLNAGGSGGGAASLPQSFPPYTAASVADASTSTQRDALLFIVGDGGNTSTGKQVPWFVGFVSEGALRSESSDVPMTVLIPALFGTIRTTMTSASSTAGGGAPSSSGGMLLTIDATPPPQALRVPQAGASSAAPLTAPVLLVDIRGSVRKQFCIHLVKLEVSSERRRSAQSLLTRALLSGHTTAMLQLERERRARAEAEDAVSRAHALLMEHGSDAAAAIGTAGRNIAASKDAVRAKLTRPTSIINPQQKGPTKRPRGVKLN
jgi:hypothetical protein